MLDVNLAYPATSLFFLFKFYLQILKAGVQIQRQIWKEAFPIPWLTTPRYTRAKLAQAKGGSQEMNLGFSMWEAGIH